MLVGIALLLLDRRTAIAHVWAQYLAIVCTLIAFIALIGFAYGVDSQSLYGMARYTQMAVHTALGFTILAGGVLCAWPSHGPVVALMSPGIGGFLARRLLPAAVVIPAVLGWFKLVGERAGLFNSEVGTTLVVIGSITVFSGLFLLTIRVLHRMDNDRQEAQAAQVQANTELAIRVRELARINMLTQEQSDEILRSVNVLGSSAIDIVASTSELAAGASQTATAVSQTTATVEEVRQTALLSNQKARELAEAVRESAAVSELGKSATDETALGMARIREQMEALSQGIDRLIERSNAIGQIAGTIDGLARQSNLLAVNAAIEAAKAGEQGKGFAVVAQEVRSLAEQSKQATAQVRALLDDIQQATAAAVIATDQAMKVVDSGVQQSTAAGASILTLFDSMTAGAQAATQIAASSQQQLAGMDQVAAAMLSIRQASNHNIQSARQLEDAARKLSALGQRLKETVNHTDLVGIAGTGS